LVLKNLGTEEYMALVSATLVKELREKTGAGMMDCKTALAQAKDMDDAIRILREKGLAQAAKKTSRVASEGLVDIASSGSERVAMIELNCETDFVSRNNDFKSLCSELSKVALSFNVNGMDQTNIEGSKLFSMTMPSGQTVEATINEKIATIGEKIDLRRFCVLSEGDLYGTYTHGAGSIGVLVECKLNDKKYQNEEVVKAARDLAMHVAAANPMFISENDIDEGWLKSEKAIFRAQVIDKPEHMIEKIVEGKLNKHKKEFCLLEQSFVKNPELTVKAMLDELKKKTGAQISVTRMVRFKVGEGIEKKEDNFAEEVKKMTT
jgi:elongation factor Ts